MTKNTNSKGAMLEKIKQLQGYLVQVTIGRNDSEIANKVYENEYEDFPKQILNLFNQAISQREGEIIAKVKKETQTMVNPYHKEEYEPGDPAVQRSLGFGTALIRIQLFLDSLPPLTQEKVRRKNETKLE